jgi:hypothetical protein
MQIYESTGIIEKEEYLKSLDFNILENTHVLESQQAYPGYHGEVPEYVHPNMVYLITDMRYPFEKVLRVGEHLKEIFDFSFDPTPADLFIYNEMLPSIRIRNIDSFKKIRDLQCGYMDEGITFAKKRKTDAKGMIKIIKTLYIEEVTPYIYSDLDEENTNYLLIPEKLTWKKFEIISKRVKNNLENNNYDAAMATLLKKQIMDFVRIYSKEQNPGRLEEIRNQYLREINRLNKE